jgi:hypothetical protein
VSRPRVLVTGYRRYGDVAQVNAVLADVLARLGPFVLVHGACDTGADKLADDWARDNVEYGVTVERHPANWTGPCRSVCNPRHRRLRAGGGTYCPAAGPLRNADMVHSGIVECHNFTAPGSRGGVGTAAAARKAGIATADHLDASVPSGTEGSK